MRYLDTQSSHHALPGSVIEKQEVIALWRDLHTGSRAIVDPHPAQWSEIYLEIMSDNSSNDVGMRDEDPMTVRVDRSYVFDGRDRSLLDFVQRLTARGTGFMWSRVPVAFGRIIGQFVPKSIHPFPHPDLTESGDHRHAHLTCLPQDLRGLYRSQHRTSVEAGNLRMA